MTQAVQVAQYGSNNVGLSFKNRIINGDMRIDQRNAGALVSISGGTNYITDRFPVSIFGTTYSSPAITAQQVTDAPSGFVNSLKITSASTITPDANKLGSWLEHKIEGYNVADLGWGTANAKTVTISFWVKASKTGIVSVSLENSATDRSYLTTVSISSAATWEYKTVTIAGDTSGTWLTNNGGGIYLKIGVMSNASWLAGTGGSWSSTRALLSTSQTNFIAASGDYLEITGVQLEKGSVATSFDYRPYGTELALCERYYELCVGSMFLPSINSGSYFGNATNFRASKRATPTVTRISDYQVSSVNTPYSEQISINGFRAMAQASATGAAHFMTLYGASSEL